MKRLLKDLLIVIVILLALLMLISFEALIDWIASFEFFGDLLIILIAVSIVGFIIGSIIKPDKF